MGENRPQVWSVKIPSLKCLDFHAHLKFNSDFTPENGWLEDKPFLLGLCNFSGAMLNFRGVTIDGRPVHQSSPPDLCEQDHYPWKPLGPLLKVKLLVGCM